MSRARPFQLSLRPRTLFDIPSLAILKAWRGSKAVGRVSWLALGAQSPGVGSQHPLCMYAESTLDLYPTSINHADLISPFHT